MKRLLLLVTLLFTLQCITAQNTWTPKTDFGGIARNYAVGFSIGSKGYIGTGSNGSNRKDFWEYDPATDTWMQKADFEGTARNSAVGFSIGTKGYIGTGYDGSGKKDFWEYDPSLNAWTQKTDFGGAARYNAVGFSIGTKGYIGTGTASSYTKDFWEYDPATDTWMQKADFGGTARFLAVGFGISTKGYIATGYENFGSYKKDIWEYDPSTGSLGTWTQKTAFGGTGRFGAVGFSTNTKGYIGTGLDASNRKDFWEYDPSTDTWTRKTDFAGSARYATVGFGIGSKGYIGTGFDGNYKKDFWEYTPTITATVTTTAASSITASTAQSGGNVTADGGGTVTERGVVYSTTTGPTISNSKVISGSGTGSFTSSLTGLSASTTYYVRAYAINSAGTGYGDEINFTTSAAPCSTPNIQQAVNSPTGTIPFSVATGDVNGDGKADLAVANLGSNTVSVFLNNGNGTFAAAVSYPAGTNPHSVAIGDLNGDGKADLVVANYYGSSNTVSVLLNTGVGTFAAPISYTTGTASEPFSVAIGDLNGDGDADLAVANANGGYVSVLLNNGSGAFAGAVNYTTGTTPLSVAIQDVSGDGRADIAVANSNSGYVSILINNGSGAFAAAVNYTAGSYPISVAFGDVNGDGKADLAVANYNSSSASVLLNNGSGTFVAAVNYPTGTQPYSVAIGDVNGDGKPDLATANSGSNNVSVLLNNGSGIYATAVNYATGQVPVSVAIGDLNADGIGDLAVANHNSNTVSVFLNSCPTPTITTITSSLNPSCPGSNVTFTATVLINGNAGTPATAGTVTFTQGTTVLADDVALNSSGQAAFSTDTLGAGAHAIIATYNPSAGLAASDGSINQVVNARPTGTISGSGTYCNGANTTTSLTLTVNGSGTISGTLSDNTSFSGIAPTINVSVSPTATTTYTIATLSDDNCTAQASDLSSSATVTVNPLPAATISGTTAVCVSSPSPNITFTGSGGTEPYTFTYTINDGPTQTVSTSTGSSVTVAVPTSSAGTFTYKLVSVADASSSQCMQTISGQTATVTVNGLPTGTISGSTSVCQYGASPNITFSGSGGTAPYTFTYTLYNGTTTATYTATGNPATVAVPTTTTGSYTYTLVNVQDASSTQCSQTITNQAATVTVNPLPDATITTASVVTGGSSGNTASVPDAGSGATYTWGISNGTITAGAGTRSITYKAGNSGTVNISVSVTGSGGCGPVNGSAIVPVTPVACPNAAITVASFVCSASAGNIASVANAGTGATYVWSITRGTITSGGGTRQITFTASTNTNSHDDYISLSVKVTNASGCPVSSGIYKICISPIPSAAISTPSSVCSLSQGNVASVAFACNGATYNWSITNGTITGGAGTRCITYTAGTTGSVTLSVIVTNNKGCSASGTKKVSIQGLPLATITTVSSVCSRSCGHTASVPKGGTGTKYAWSISNGSINSGSNTNSITYSAGTSGSVTLTVIVTNSSGCKASSGNKVVTIVALPNANITAASSICASSTGNVASVSSAGTGASYTWKISGGTITSGSGTNNIKYTAGSPGSVTLSVTVINSNGCKATCSKKITITAKVVPTFTQVAALCKNAKVPSLPAKSNNGITGAWSPSKVNTSSVSTTTYTFTPASGQCASSTTMKITVKNCSARSDVNTVTHEEIIIRETLVLKAVISPNPSQAYFTLILKGNPKEVAHIIVSDLLGRNLDHFTAGTGSSVRFGDNYAHGTYIVQIVQGKERKILKVIKQ